jgi:hypothetical protein
MLLAIALPIMFQDPQGFLSGSQKALLRALIELLRKGASAWLRLPKVYLLQLEQTICTSQEGMITVASCLVTILLFQRAFRLS